MRAFHISFVVLAASLVCTFTLLQGCSSKISEQEVQSVIQAVDKAANDRSVKGILTHMADDVVVKLILTDGSQNKLYSLNRAQYAMLLEEGFKVAKEYEYGRKDTTISIAPDGKSAEVSSQTIETLTFPDGSQRSEAEETAILELRNGKVVITSVKAVQHI